MNEPVKRYIAARIVKRTKTKFLVFRQPERGKLLVDSECLVIDDEKLPIKDIRKIVRHCRKISLESSHSKIEFSVEVPTINISSGSLGSIVADAIEAVRRGDLECADRIARQFRFISVLYRFAAAAVVIIVLLQSALIYLMPRSIVLLLCIGVVLGICLRACFQNGHVSQSRIAARNTKLRK